MTEFTPPPNGGKYIRLYEIGLIQTVQGPVILASSGEGLIWDGFIPILLFVKFPDKTVSKRSMACIELTMPLAKVLKVSRKQYLEEFMVIRGEKQEARYESWRIQLMQMGAVEAS